MISEVGCEYEKSFSDGTRVGSDYTSKDRLAEDTPPCPQASVAMEGAGLPQRSGRSLFSALESWWEPLTAPTQSLGQKRCLGLCGLGHQQVRWLLLGFLSQDECLGSPKLTLRSLGFPEAPLLWTPHGEAT